MPYKFTRAAPLGATIDSLQDLIDKNIIVEVKDHWVPKFEQEYWYISHALALSHGTCWPTTNTEGPNLFPTQELAQLAADEVKTLLKDFHKRHDTANYGKWKFNDTMTGYNGKLEDTNSCGASS